MKRAIVVLAALVVILNEAGIQVQPLCQQSLVAVIQLLVDGKS